MTKIYLLLAILSTSLLASAQIQTKGVAILNGGQFGNALENVHLTWFDPATNAYTTLDTVHTSSAQDMILDGHLAYVAAQDSIVLYNLATGDRIAANTFGGPSTISLALYGDYLIAGNWYPPFGWVGPYENHLRIFDRYSLAFVDSIPEIRQGAKDMVVLGDTLYLSQNLSSSAFADSAGWMVKVHLPTLSYVDSVAVNNTQADFGRLWVHDEMLYGLNAVSNTITQYDPLTGMVTTDTANADLQTSTYNDRVAVDENGVIFTYIDGKIASYDLPSRQVLNANLVDTAVLAFALDTLADRFYLTQTDFFSYTGGLIYAADGSGKIDTLLTGSAPEGILVVYNTAPVAADDLDTVAFETVRMVGVLGNDIDPDPQDTFSLRILTGATQGNAVVVGDSLQYTPNAGFMGQDSVQYEAADVWGDKDTAWLQLTVLGNVGLAVLQDVHLRLFPNPSTGALRLSHALGTNFGLNLLDIQGRIIWQGVSEMGQLDQDFSQLPAALYLVAVDLPAGRQVFRWQKQ